MVGILIVPSSELFARLWAMQWHWSHAGDVVPSCSLLWMAGLVSWLGVPAAAVAVALLTKQRAAFATTIGLIVYLPIGFTETFSGNRFATFSALFMKSCGLDVDPTELEAARSGMAAGAVTALVVQALLMIFVSKLVSTWISRIQRN